MGMRQNQSKTRWTNTIKRMFLEVNAVDGDKRLRLTVEREGSKYPDWYSCGDAKDIVLNKKGTKWTPADFQFPAGSMAMWYMNELFKLAEEAEVPFDDADLESFWGLRIQTENRTYKTKVKGKAIEREKPFPTGVFISDGMPVAVVSSDLGVTLKKLLEANDGEMEVAAINARALKGVVDSDYTTRKDIATQLSKEDFLGGVEGVTFADGVAALA